MIRIIDLVTLMAYSFKEDSFHPNAEKFFAWVEQEKVGLLVIETMVLEAEAIYLAGKVSFSTDEWAAFIGDILTSPILNRVILDKETFAEHLALYRGWDEGQFTYFGSFHGALAKVRKVPLVTTDKMLLQESSIPTEDLRVF